MSSRKSLPPSEQEAGAKRLRDGEDGQILEAVSGTQQRASGGGAGGGAGGVIRRKRHQKSEATQAKALAAEMRNALGQQWLFPQLPQQQQQQQQPPLEVELLEHFHQRKLQEKDCEIQDKDQQIAAMKEHMERMEQEYRLLQRKEQEIQQKDQEISTLKQQLEEMDVIFPPARMEDGGGGGDAAAAEAFVGGILGLEGQPHWGYWEGL